MKQRDQIVMSDAEVDTFLSAQRSATVGTLGPAGQIHLVGMWFAWFEGHVWFETKPKSQKVVNLRRDPRMSFLVETGQTYDVLRGVAIEGKHHRVVIRLDITRVRSWDHRKLGLPAMELGGTTAASVGQP